VIRDTTSKASKDCGNPDKWRCYATEMQKEVQNYEGWSKMRDNLMIEGGKEANNVGLEVTTLLLFWGFKVGS
jgi:hypothetical protein